MRLQAALSCVPQDGNHPRLIAHTAMVDGIVRVYCEFIDTEVAKGDFGKMTPIMRTTFYQVSAPPFAMPSSAISSAAACAWVVASGAWSQREARTDAAIWRGSALSFDGGCGAAPCLCGRGSIP